MPAIDWAHPGLHLVLAAAGVLLVVLGVLFAFLPAARVRGLALAVGVAGGLAAGCALGLHLTPAPPPAADRTTEAPVPEPRTQPAPLPAPLPGPVDKHGLDRFRRATPAERMAMLRGLPDGEAAWYAVERGDVGSLIERGALESADNADVVVKVHAYKPGGVAATIRKVLADDGTAVKKGQLLVELDDAELQERLKAQQIAVEQKKTEMIQADKQAELDDGRVKLDLDQAKHQLALAERDLKAYTGDDAERRKGLELKVKEARQLVKTREFQAETTKTRAQVARMTARTAFDTEVALARQLEADIAACKLVAPRDGMVVYHVPPRWGATMSVLAPGEPVQEGQKLAYLPDLSKMQVDVPVHESQVPLVRLEQPASVRVDAMPGRALAGKVAHIANVGRRQGDVRVYPVKVALAGETPGLKPGMSAEVRVRVEPHRNVPRVPVRALVAVGGRLVCFVRHGEEVQERLVTLGLGDDDFVEVAGGLKEGDRVLRDPRAVARRLAGLGPDGPNPAR